MSAKAPEPPPSNPTPPASSAATPPPPAPAPAAPAPAKAAPVKAAPVKAAPRPAAPAKPRPPRSSTGVAGGAFVVAVCALLVAIGAIAVSIYSLKVARDALSKNADRATVATPSSTTPPALAAPPPTVNTTASAPRVTYSSELVRAEVKVPAPTGCNAVYLDIDTLAIGNFIGHEFYMSTCGDPQVLTVRVDNSSGAAMSSSTNPSPEVCGSLVAGTSTIPELVLTARSGLTFCMLTNKADSAQQSLPQRLAIVEVRDVGVDKSATLAVSTFRVISS